MGCDLDRGPVERTGKWGFETEVNRDGAWAGRGDAGERIIDERCS